MNITIYGDSILKGVLLEDGRYTVNKEWERRFSGLFDVGVLNRSRFGCTIRKAIAQIRKDGDRRYGAEEYALLEFGGNDCDYHWDEIASSPREEHDCKTPPGKFMETYREAVSLVRQSGRVPVIVTLPPVHSERYLRFICRDGLSRENILFWLGDVDRIYRWQAEYSRMAEQIAMEEGTELIDLRGAFLRDGRTPEELLCDDGIHPSRSGQDVIFRTLCGCVA